MRSALPLLLLATSLSAATYSHDPTAAEEFRARAGLPNVFAKIEAGQTVRVAYLGGSITAAKGWRVKTMAWLKSQYPKATFEEINAAISGTGSDYSACRLQTDVLDKNPDLIFLECRVNGHGGFPVQSVEGIVRHTWQASPKTDLCFIYTVGTWMLKDLHAGKAPGFGVVMEKIANHYGIPTIDLGVEVAKQEAAGTLIFKGSEPVPGKTVFSADGVHPGGPGHDIYRDVIARSFLKMADTAAATPHSLPESIHKHPWQVGSLLPISKATLSSGWTPVDEDKDPVYTDDRWRTKCMLHGAVKTSKPGQTITVRWNGTTIGFSDIPHGGPMLIDVSVDGNTPEPFQRTQREAKRQYSRFFYLRELPPGDHTAVLTVKELPDGVSFYAGHILIAGTPLP